MNKTTISILMLVAFSVTLYFAYEYSEDVKIQKAERERRFVLKLNSLFITPMSKADLQELCQCTIKVISSTNLSVISNVEIENIKVFNSLGQKINEFSNIDSKEAILKTVIKNQSTYLLQIQLIDGKIINKKIIF